MRAPAGPSLAKIVVCRGFDAEGRHHSFSGRRERKVMAVAAAAVAASNFDSGPYPFLAELIGPHFCGVRPEGPRREQALRCEAWAQEPRFECTQHATNKKDPSRGSVLLVRPEGFEPPTF